MTRADQHAIRLHIGMMIMLAREIPTREARIKHMVGQTFSGPHFGITRDQVVIDEDAANYVADLLDAESSAVRDEHLQKLAAFRESYSQARRST